MTPVPRARDVLYRFRPAGAPGAATAAGVPRDRRADAAVELEGVFSLLESSAQEGQAIVAEAMREAERIGQDAAERAAQIIAAASSRTDAERTTAVAEARRVADAESLTLARSAASDADALLARARGRMPDVSKQVLARVLALLGEPPGGGQEVAAS